MEYRKYNFSPTIIYYDDNYVEVTRGLEAIKVYSKRKGNTLLIIAKYEDEEIFFSRKEYILPLENLNKIDLYLAKDGYYFSEKEKYRCQLLKEIEIRKIYLVKEIEWYLIFFILLIFFFYQNGNLSICF